MGHSDIWDTLGIAPTNDVKRIKRAYAAQSRLHHPEEEPEEFDRLHQSYEAALDYAKNAACVVVSGEAEAGDNKKYIEYAGNIKNILEPAETQKESREPETEKAQASPAIVETQEPEIIYDEFVAQGAEKERQKNIDRLMETIELYHEELPSFTGDEEETERKEVEKWLGLFRAARYEKTVWDEDFIKRLCEWMEAHKKALSGVETASIYRTYRFWDYQSPTYNKNVSLARLYILIMAYMNKHRYFFVTYGGMKTLKGILAKEPKGKENEKQDRAEKTKKFRKKLIVVVIVLSAFRFLIGLGSCADPYAKQYAVIGEAFFTEKGEQKWQL